MKLYMLFIVMDLFTLLAYPFVLMHGKLGQFSKARNVLVTLLTRSHPADDLSEKMNIRKKGDYAYSKD